MVNKNNGTNKVVNMKNLLYTLGLKVSEWVWKCDIWNVSCINDWGKCQLNP